MQLMYQQIIRWSLALAALGLAGCAQLDLVHKIGFDIREGIPWGAGQDGTLDKPVKVAAVWTETVMCTSGQPAIRGFGGRLMFYEKAGAAPAKVAGSLVIYAFDETERRPGDNKPTKKYVFTAEQLDKHYSKSELGDSYSVWLPWDEVGGDQREISLIVNFKPELGGMVSSDQSRHILPGKAPDLSELATGPTARKVSWQKEPPTGEAPFDHHQAGYAQQSNHAPYAGQEPQRRRMQTTTIEMPQRMGLSEGAHYTVSHTDPRQTPPQTTAYTPSTSTQGAQPEVMASRFQPRAAGYSPPRARFSLERSHPLAAPLERLERDHSPSEPYPSTQQYFPPR